MAIHVAADDKNVRGDLFNERMKDVVQALGYEVIRTNIHKPGREIDIVAKHVVEDRRALIECKAKKEKIGGGDINKFVGAMDAEKRSVDEALSGFFVSVSGFTESAIEQESATERKRLSLLGPIEIEEQLLRGRIIVPRETAFFRAGSVAPAPGESVIDSEADLVADQSGWLWLIYFLSAGERVAFTLIHADGDFPSYRVGQRIARYIKRISSMELDYLGGAQKEVEEFTREKSEYLRYILSEYGEFTLEGFPVDQHLGSKSIALEELYVPQFLESAEEASETEQSTPMNTRKERHPLSQILEQDNAVTILGPPGAGKSTLIKRLATGYAAPDRLARISDGLPEADRLPLVLRCRELQGSNASVIAMLRSIPERAEMPSIKTSFSALVDKSVKDGSALILIDGLDEFPTASDRARFLRQLRTFMMRYPLCTVVVTSREAGFREVAGFVGDSFAKYRIAELRNEDIFSLTAAWHKQVYGDTQAARTRAVELVEKIIETDRVRRLAVNPLLLTTLLLVQRWVGDLPRKRSVLYEKAIELLLMTWNVEGHEPLDLDEVKPHLAYLAHSMTVSGKQQISHEEMLALFRNARSELEEVLGYCTTSPQELLRRIEFRSSLLNLVGYAVHDGTLQPIYEFKHLTFQEYLAAVAIAQAWHEGADFDSDSVDEIKEHVFDPRWREVIALYGVLSGRKGRRVIELLCDLAEQYDHESVELDESEDEHEDFELERPQQGLRYLLYQCLVDEVQAPSDLAERALDLVVSYVDDGEYDALLTGRYGQQFTGLAESEVADPSRGDSPFVTVLARLLFVELSRASSTEQVIEILKARIHGSLLRDQVGALGGLMYIAYWTRTADDELAWLGLDLESGKKVCEACFEDAVSHIDSGNVIVRFSALWATAWITDSFRPSRQRQAELFPRFAELYFTDDDEAVRRMAAWSLAGAISDYKPSDLELSPVRLERIDSWLEVPVSSESWIPHEARAAIWFAVHAKNAALLSKVSRISEALSDSSELAEWIQQLVRQ
ncbi:restriction endonuclease [Streptomyces chartreusis]|uniref:restriction endonuclease n=1 Tax=Streptomyces chartreusis TaxID=1969 RepID=UPI003625C97D